MRISPARPGSGRRAFGLLLAACGLLAGCGTSGIQVEREAHLPPGSAGASFMVLAARGQDNDPGYARNAELIAAELTARHFVRVTEPTAAHFAVMVWERRRDTPARDARPSESSTSGSRGRGRGGS
jgi:glutathione S-transferase